MLHLTSAVLTAADTAAPCLALLGTGVAWHGKSKALLGVPAVSVPMRIGQALPG